MSQPDFQHLEFQGHSKQSKRIYSFESLIYLHSYGLKPHSNNITTKTEQYFYL